MFFCNLFPVRLLALGHRNTAIGKGMAMGLFYCNKADNISFSGGGFFIITVIEGDREWMRKNITGSMPI